MPKPTERDELVERQVTTWASHERQSEETSKIAVTQPPRGGGPWVTVSLQLGSGGVQLGTAVAERLGWRLFNKEVLHAIADRMHIRAGTLSRIDGHAVGALQDYLDHLFVEDHPGRIAYVKTMVGVVANVAHEGRAVIVGRGANWILDPADGLRVRVIAPEGMRVERLVQTTAISAAEAQRQVLHDDADRAAFVRQAFNKDVADPLGYDLVINRGVLDHEAAVASVIAALESKLSHRLDVQAAR